MKNKNIVYIVLLAIVITSIPAYAIGKYKGYTIAKVNIDGKDVVSDVPPIIMDDRTLVPLRVVSEYLGADVEWDGKTKSVSIKSNTDLSTTELIEKHNLDKNLYEYEVISERILQTIRENSFLKFSTISNLSKFHIWEVVEPTVYSDFIDSLDDVFYNFLDSNEDNLDTIYGNNIYIDELVKELKSKEREIESKINEKDNLKYSKLKAETNKLIVNYNNFKKEFEEFENLYDDYIYNNLPLDMNKLNSIIDKSLKVFEKVNNSMHLLMDLIYS